MKNTTESINWQEKFHEAEERLAKLEALVKYYEEQFRLAKHRQFGRSSEKFDSAEQYGLFNEAENTAAENAPEPEVEQIVYTRKKRVGKRADDLSGLPVETVEYTLPESEQICPECGGAMHVMSHEVRKEIKIVPAQVSVVEHKQAVYACRDCERNAESTPIITADAPEPVIKGSIASPSAVAYIMTQKYVMATPLYRQEQDLKRQGIALSRQTMANWIVRCAETWLLPLYMLLMSLLVKLPVLHADETVLQVLHEPGKAASTNSYMWLYRTSGCAEHSIVLYEYQPSRSSSHPLKFLSEFKGFLHTDGYEGYRKLPDVIIVGCWAHARRKFDEALKAMPKEQRVGSASKKGLEYCLRLFMLEREFERLTPDERYQKRLELSFPIAEEFLTWAKSVNALPQSGLGKALYYLIAQWPQLKNVYLDGRLELSNNRAENSIRPFVMGRKNWLFCNSQKGAQASAVIFSIIETAKENRLNPFEYLKFLFEELPNAKASELERFLPWSPFLPHSCMSKNNKS